MAKAQLLGYVHVVTHRQDASCRFDALLRDDHGTVVERRVLEEDVLYQQFVDACVDLFTGLHNIVKRCGPLDDDKGSHLFLCHIHARPYDRHDGSLVLVLPIVLAL